MAGAPDPALVEWLAGTAVDRLAWAKHRPLLFGLCGAQGSGKSTLAEALADRLRGLGRSVAILSLDDLYKTRATREALARDVHPLFRTRGVPGTHDLGLAFAALDRLAAGEDAVLPRFDKSRDDRLSLAEWAPVAGDTDILIFEGWCVGARPLLDEPGIPINPLERDEDADGVWRRAVAAALAGDYQRLFDRIDLLVLLAAPGFEVVLDWRIEQEEDARASGRGAMSDAEIARFIQHYERLTRHILATMPDYADITIRLDAGRRIIGVSG